MSTDRVESEPGRLGDDELNAAGALALGIALAVTDAVEVRAEQHELAREIAARQIGDDVEAVGIRLVVELRLDLELDLHRNALVQDPEHAVVMLDGQRHARHDVAGVGGVVGTAGARKDRAAVSALRAPRHLVVASDQ